MVNKKQDKKAMQGKAGAEVVCTPSVEQRLSAEKLLHELQVHQIELQMQNEELHQTQVILEESRDRYADLYDFAPVGYLTLTHEGMVSEANLTAVAQLGVERNILLKRHFVRWITPQDSDRWHLYFLRVMQQNEPQTCELRLQRSDGTFFDAHLNGLPRLTDSATPTLRMVLTDISERKRMDQLLWDKNAELELAMQIAEKANRAKSAFLSNMSHELRTPLNAILGFAQLMEAHTQPQTDIQRARVRKIIEAGWYLLDLINEILDLATIESGRLQLSLEHLPLASIMHECQALIEAQAEQRGIRISFTPCADDCHVYADRIRLKQALINLLSNALKYNREHGVIEVRCICTTERLRLYVRDSGAGLSEEKLAQLFQPFNRLGQEGGGEEGTGIGLVMAKRLIELMGGMIGVESTAGTGSEFWIELPRNGPPQPLVEKARPARAALQKTAKGAPRTLLYIVDDPASLLLVEQIIGKFPQLRMLSANEGYPGIELARAHLPDVILMDIHLPDISGLEALKILRNDPATMHIPVIAISANAPFSDLAMGLDAGFLEYLTKPIKISELTSVLDDILTFSEMKLAHTPET